MSKFLISTPIYYVNAPRVHLGHALSTLIADILARRARLLGQQVHFSTGTDEHGVKVARAAEEAGLSPQQFADQNAANFQASFDRLNITYDHFVRTTAPQHKQGAQKFLQKIYDNGYIYKDTYQGLYCEGCEAFVKKSDLTPEGLCPLHQTKPQEYEEENYFFKLKEFEKKLKKAIQTDQIKIVPANKKKEALSLIEQGLEDFSVSRQKLKWGIPVPWDETQVIYVWVEALSNYLTTAGYGSDEKKFQQLWPTDLNVLGKDILRFHSLYWPALLWAAGLEAPKVFFVHAFLNVAGQKMSKTLGNIVYPEDLIEKFGVDGARYLIVAELPREDDTSVSLAALEEKYTGHLKNGLGNFFSRVIALGQKANLQKISLPAQTSSLSSSLQKLLERTQKQTEQAFQEFDIKKALELSFSLISYGDRLLEQQKPWERLANNSLQSRNSKDQRLTEVVLAGLEIVRQVALLTAPVLPATARLVHEHLGLSWQEALKPGEFEKLQKFGRFDLQIPQERIHLFS